MRPDRLGLGPGDTSPVQREWIAKPASRLPDTAVFALDAPFVDDTDVTSSTPSLDAIEAAYKAANPADTRPIPTNSKENAMDSQSQDKAKQAHDPDSNFPASHLHLPAPMPISTLLRYPCHLHHPSNWEVRPHRDPPVSTAAQRRVPVSTAHGKSSVALARTTAPATTIPTATTARQEEEEEVSEWCCSRTLTSALTLTIIGGGGGGT